MNTQFFRLSLLSVACMALLASCGGGGGTDAASTSQTSSPSTAAAASTQSGTTMLTGTTPPAPTTVAQAPTTPTTETVLTAPISVAPVSTGPVNLCDGIPVTGKTLVNYSPLAKPAKGQTVIDPDFGVKITRVTDGLADWGAGVSIPAYPTAQAWNADESRFILYVTDSRKSGAQTGYAMFDGTTYKFIKWLPINPPDIEQFYWSKTDPTRLVYIDNRESGGTIIMKMMAINVETGVQTVLHDFMPDIKAMGWSTAGPVRAGYPFMPGGNLQLFGLGAGGIPDVNSQMGLNVFGFDATTNKITLYKGIAQAQARGSTPFPLKSGNGWAWPDWSNMTTKVFDLNGNIVRTVPFNADEHLDSATNAKGEDLLVGTQFDGPSGSGNLMVANLTTGGVSTLIGMATGDGYPRTGALIGAGAYRNPGWVVEGITGDIHLSKTYLDQEVLLANVDTKQICRIAHHRSTGYWANAAQNNYWAQTNVTLSPSGTRILVQSDWGAATPGSGTVANPSAIIDTYVITLPSYKP